MNIRRIIREELEDGLHEPNPEDWDVFVDDVELKTMLDLIYEDTQYEVTIGDPTRAPERYPHLNNDRIHVWDKGDYASGAYVILDKTITLEEFITELNDESLNTEPNTHLFLQYYNLLSYTKHKSRELFNL